ncbi:MAG TPA: hypothetical protein VEZ17_18610 [Chitinophagaceae bacterium]|jgi:hypothetical protein|nr:hypothetical protein [Chitinophagaceae bacterium]
MTNTNFFTPRDDEDELSDASSSSLPNDALEDDDTPVLDEEDLEENNLTVEEAENIEWEEPKKGTSNK